MPNAEDFVTGEEYAAQAREASGVRHQSAGAAPYPLYGIPGLGQEESIPFWRKPWFCYTVGGAAGIGIGYAIFGWLMPRMKRNPKKPKKNPRQREVSEQDDDR